VPEISRFSGIVIAMYHNDHAPPHFHAYHASDEAKFHIRTGECLWGALPPAARRLVLKWADLHRDELLANWRLAELEQPLNRIDPLE